MSGVSKGSSELNPWWRGDLISYFTLNVSFRSTGFKSNMISPTFPYENQWLVKESLRNES